MKFDMNKMLQEAQRMQAELAKAQEEAASEIVEASAGGGMVTVKANGAGEVVSITIDPRAIDPDDPELLADLVLAAVNEALRSATRADGVEDVRPHARRARRPRRAAARQLARSAHVPSIDHEHLQVGLVERPARDVVRADRRGARLVGTR